MRPKHPAGTEVPADLAVFDIARWEAAAAGAPDADGWRYRRATDLYFDALIAAGVPDDEAARLIAAAVVAYAKRKLGWRGP